MSRLQVCSCFLRFSGPLGISSNQGSLDLEIPLSDLSKKFIDDWEICRFCRGIVDFDFIGILYIY